MALMSVMVSAVSAQVARGGWGAYTTEDEFTGKKNHYMRYFDDRERWTASFFPGPNRLGVLEWYDGVLFMDETLEAVTERHGEFPDRQVDYEWRVALPKDDSNEDFGTVKMTFGDVERAGDTFFGTFVFDMDAATMKAGRSVAVRWTDPLRGKQVVRKISLAGFTRCFDECIRRYREDRR
jgi:hypothetical protein